MKRQREEKKISKMATDQEENQKRDIQDTNICEENRKDLLRKED